MAKAEVEAVHLQYTGHTSLELHCMPISAKLLRIGSILELYSRHLFGVVFTVLLHVISLMLLYFDYFRESKERFFFVKL